MKTTPLSLSAPIGALKGIGKTKEALLFRLGISTVSELLCYFPHDWIDTALSSVADAREDGAVHLLRLDVLTHPSSAFVRGGKRLVSFEAEDQTGKVSVCFLNQPYAQGAFSKGETVLLLGRIGVFKDKNYLFSPQKLKTLPQSAFLPVYPKTKGLSDNAIRSAVAQVLELCSELTDPLPQKLLEKNDLLSLGETVKILHAPPSSQALARARQRLVYEQMLRYGVRAAAFEKSLSLTQTEPFLKLDLKEFFPLLPFAPTACQQRAMEQIARDLKSGRPMNRLLQGDVGSGKTVIAAAACFLCAQNGYNSAVMAPTEILARQHFAFFSKLFSSLPLRVVFLSGSSSAKERREFNLAFEGSLPVIAVGTHALLEEKAKMSRLALAVTDEQQRFGVNQRGRLIHRCDLKHSLVMTATPIPRSLALFLFDEKRISVLDELPPGRKPVSTYLIGEDKRERMNGFLERKIQEGDQAYVVCPLIEEGEDPGELKSAREVFDELSSALPHRRFLLLHGRMSAEEKEKAMASFERGEADVLVSTTVIEVGVNVPSANLMIVENAERFGLSQLHQLRGRVGRGNREAHCVLMTPRRDRESLKRLKLLTSTTDGFAIARYDLEHRGPGDFLGTRQSGKLSELFSDENADGVLQKTKEDALWLFKACPEEAKALLGASHESYFH